MDPKFNTFGCNRSTSDAPLNHCGVNVASIATRSGSFSAGPHYNTGEGGGFGISAGHTWDHKSGGSTSLRGHTGVMECGSNGVPYVSVSLSHSSARK